MDRISERPGTSSSKCREELVGEPGVGKGFVLWKTWKKSQCGESVWGEGARRAGEVLRGPHVPGLCRGAMVEMWAFSGQMRLTVD